MAIVATKPSSPLSVQHLGLKQCTAEQRKSHETIILKEIPLVCSGFTFFYGFGFN